MRENRTHGSEGGEGCSPSRPLSPEGQQASQAMDSPGSRQLGVGQDLDQGRAVVGQRPGDRVVELGRLRDPDPQAAAVPGAGREVRVVQGGLPDLPAAVALLLRALAELVVVEQDERDLHAVLHRRGQALAQVPGRPARLPGAPVGTRTGNAEPGFGQSWGSRRLGARSAEWWPRGQDPGTKFAVRRAVSTVEPVATKAKAIP